MYQAPATCIVESLLRLEGRYIYYSWLSTCTRVTVNCFLEFPTSELPVLPAFVTIRTIYAFLDRPERLQFDRPIMYPIP